MDVDGNAENEAIPNPMVDYNSSDNDDDEADPEQKDVTDALDLSTVLQEALENVDAAALEDGDQRGGVQDYHVEHNGATQQDSPPNGNGEDSVSKSEEDSGPSTTPGLKPTSSDPMLASIAHLPSGDTEVLSNVKAAPKPNVYAPMRERIVYSDTDKLFIDLDDYDGLVRDLALSTGDTTIEAPPPPPDLSAIFPDLQPFGLLNVPLVPTSVTSTDTRKKPERKSDRDDPNKRVEDTSYTKLVPLGEFMHCKPTLIGPLNPAKHWRQGKWLSHQDTANNIENDASAANDALCGELFCIPSRHRFRFGTRDLRIVWRGQTFLVDI
jgi:chromatin modification-related protein VID21